MSYIKTTKKITDFFNNNFNYSLTKLDGNIYQNDITKEYFQINDVFLNIPKNELNDSKWITITEEFHYRPDRLAYAMYGNELLYWVILQHNGIKDPLELEIGKIIEIPSLSQIHIYINKKRNFIKYR